MQAELQKILVSQKALALKLNSLATSPQNNTLNFKLVSTIYPNTNTYLDLSARLEKGTTSAIKLVIVKNNAVITTIHINLPCTATDISIASITARYNEIAEELFWRDKCTGYYRLFHSARQKLFTHLQITGLGDIKTKYNDIVNASQCLALASKYHYGQLDKAGKPYIAHPMAVANSFADNHLKGIAYLHDILEDTSCTVATLKAAHIPDVVIASVANLTHAEGTTYEEYIRGLTRDKYAVLVKVSDLSHNIDITRLPVADEKAFKRSKRYYEAITYFANTITREEL